jgi:hypothetical protein
MRGLMVSVLVLALAAPAAHAGTRRVGSPPLRDRTAARLVHRSSFEPRRDNADENRREPTRAQLRYFRRHSTMPYKARVTGRYRGTTDEIIQWAAHKEGIRVDLLRAVAVIESYWHMSTIGDDGDSFGLFQIRRPFHCCAFLARRDTAFNADYYAAILRAYYDGKMPWLNDVDNGRVYAAGDIWGSVGAWFAGRWHTPAAEGYIARVKQALHDEPWRRPGF